MPVQTTELSTKENRHDYRDGTAFFRTSSPPLLFPRFLRVSILLQYRYVSTSHHVPALCGGIKARTATRRVPFEFVALPSQTANIFFPNGRKKKKIRLESVVHVFCPRAEKVHRSYAVVFRYRNNNGHALLPVSSANQMSREYVTMHGP